MLAVVSAVVAFDRWPGAGAQAPVKTLVLADTPAAIRVGTHSTAPSATAAARNATLAALGRPRVTTAPLGAGHGLIGIRRVPPAATPALPALPPAAAPKVPQQVQETADPIIETISNPGNTASQLADAQQGATDTAAVSVGRISPDIGNAVSGTGQTVSQTIRAVPLPGHILPGH